MALNRSNKYPGRFSPPTTARPQGAFKNRTSPTAQDGSYLEADWANDWDGFFARILTVAGVAPNGNIDSGTSSQYFDALVAAIKSNLGTAAIRNVGIGSGQIPDMSYFASSQLFNGWQKLPGGVIIQYGGTNGVTTATLNFPLQFPNNCYQVVIVADTTPGVGPSGNAVVNISSLTTLGFTAMCSNLAGQSTSKAVHWMAIGN